MNFAKKRWLPLSLTLIAVGVVIFLTALALGARGGRVYIDGKGLHSDSGNDGVAVGEFSFDTFSGASIDAQSADVIFISSDHYGVELRLPDGGEVPTVNVGRNGVLTVNVKPSTVIGVIDFTLASQNFVKVYYPQGAAFDEIAVHTASGKVDIPEMTVGQLNVKTSSGDIITSAVGYGELSLVSSSGGIKHTGSGIGAAALFKTSSGDITVNVNGCESASAESNSGRVRITGGEETALTAETSSGDVLASDGAWRDLRVTTSSGAVRVDGTLVGTTNVKCSSGDVTITAKGGAANGYALSSSSGDILVNGQRYEKHADAQSQNAADGVITVKTSSGKSNWI